MRKTTGVVLSALVIGSAACGGNATGPSTTYDSIAGSYSGAMAGTSQGIALSSTFSLTITQNGGTTGGSWALQGTLNDGFQIVNVQGTGTLTGTIASGNNPSVNLAVRTGGCPSYQANFSGAYDSANHRLTITGPVEFFAANTCNVVLTYQATIILIR
jgi:hypothetical protein